MIQYNLNFDSVNTSCQAGDLIFYIENTNFSSSGGFTNAPTALVLLFGTVVSTSNNTVTVEYDDVGNPNPIPAIGDYIVFAKSKVVNESGLKGYYLEAEFINDYPYNIELFSVGAEVIESSK